MPQKYFHDIDITSIEVLEKKLNLLLDKYTIENSHIYEHAIIHKNMHKLKNLSRKELEQYLIKNHPEIIEIINILKDEPSNSYKLKNITDEGICLNDGLFYPWNKLYNLILKHNHNLVIPSPSEYSVEKENIIDWYSFNTPIMSDPTITPMTGTGLGAFLSSAKVKYIEWITASSYLLCEFNIWKKARYYALYVENKNSEFSDIEFKQAYYYIIWRQFMINNLNMNTFDNKNVYITDYKVNDIIYRELCEDFLYILLNLLLANKIIGNEVLENSLDNKDRFFEILKGIIKDHYDQNKDGYVCLKNLRRYFVNNYLSTYQIKNILKNQNK